MVDPEQADKPPDVDGPITVIELPRRLAALTDTELDMNAVPKDDNNWPSRVAALTDKALPEAMAPSTVIVLEKTAPDEKDADPVIMSDD